MAQERGEYVGEVGSTLTIRNVQLRDAGNYSVVVGNAEGIVTSADAALTVMLPTPPTITRQPQNVAARQGDQASFDVVADGSPPLTYQWRKDGTAISGATSSSFTLRNLQPSDVAAYSVIVTGPGGAVTSANATLTVTLTPAPTITRQPQNQTIREGGSASFSVIAEGAPPLNYQWKKNGVNLSGETSSTFSVTNAQSADAGNYSVAVTNPVGSVTSVDASLTLLVEVSRLTNISILAPLAAGETMTIGTVLGGAGTTGVKPLVVRASGPALAPFGVTRTLPDPKLTLVNTSTTPAIIVAENNDWGGAAGLELAFAQLGAFPFGSPTSKDAAIHQAALAAGNYTIQVNDSANGAGSVLAELYDATPSDVFISTTPRLVNVAVLKQLGGTETLTAGFVIAGATTKRLLIRAIGPTLAAAPFNIGGTMSDPKIELFAGSARISSNDDWGGGADLRTEFVNVGAFALPATSRDAALLTALSAGNYTVQVSGSGGGGLCLMEIYEVP